MKKVKERIRDRGIDGAKPEVYDVEPPKSIAVSCDDDIKSLESLSLYFESRKVAGKKYEILVDIKVTISPISPLVFKDTCSKYL